MDWLDRSHDLTVWAVAHSPVPRVCKFVTSNGAEGFNGTISASRRLPLLHAVVNIFSWSILHYLGLRVAVLGQDSLQDGSGNFDSAQTANAEDQRRLAAHDRLFKEELRPFYGFHGEDFLDDKKSFNLYDVTPVPGATNKFLVWKRARDAQQYTVNIRKRMCSCGCHNTGMPCRHVFAVLRRNRIDGEDAQVASWGAFGTQQLCVKMAFHKRFDVLDIDWTTLGKSDVIPPAEGVGSARMAARSAKKKRKPRKTNTGRIKSTGEGRLITCGNCGGAGHNRRGCTKPAKSAPSSAKRSRPNS